MPLLNLKTTLVESINKLRFCLRLTTKLLSLDGVLKMDLNIGLDVILGELIGEKADSSELECTEIT